MVIVTLFNERWSCLYWQQKLIRIVVASDSDTLEMDLWNCMQIIKLYQQQRNIGNQSESCLATLLQKIMNKWSTWSDVEDHMKRHLAAYMNLLARESLGLFMHEMQPVLPNLMIGHEDDQDGLKIGGFLWAHRKLTSVSNSMSYG